MGRASKFSFPFPGRKPSTATRDKENHTKPTTQRSSHVPKAQRILGTDNALNIDSPARDDDRSWDQPSSASSISGMSISISEATKSVHDGASVAESHADRWDLESGVFPRYQRLRGKASSTLLGQHHGDEPGTDVSSSGRRIRHEESNSTLKSFYDRQKSPLSISQQTSASSARDLALRKGHPPVVARSPLLNVEQVHNLDDHMAELDKNRQAPTTNKLKKKNGRLELATLFPKGRKHEDGPYSGPASAPPTTAPYAAFTSRQHMAQSPQSPHDDRRQHAPPKEVRKPPIRNGPLSSHPNEEKKRYTDDTLTELYGRYEQHGMRSPRMLNIPESRVPNYEKPLRSPTRGHHESDGEAGQRNKSASHSPGEAPFSWKNMRANMGSRPWETSSAASISSRNTKTSRHTSASLLSSSNLKVDSVLSLSSGSEDEASDHEPERRGAPHVPPQVPRTTSQRTQNSYRQSVQSTQSTQSMQQAGPPPTGPLPKTNGSRRTSSQLRPSFTIPESHLPSTRISGPWAPPDLDDRHSPLSYPSDKRDRRTSKSPSSKRSSRHSTPPLSPVPPIPAEYRDDGGRSSRLMAVTEQEIALLEALRQKKARMREEIIEEHETTKTPPKATRPKAPQYPEPLARGATDSRERILLYLNAPLSDGHVIDTAEPSPDLSDFLSFGSDEESTPRSSWAPLTNGQARPDSSVSPNARRESRKSQRKGPGPITPPNAARLSAVGAIGAFPDGRAQEPDNPKTRLANGAGVQLLDERRLATALLMDEQAGGGVAWAV